jgi:hypothetical protein
MTITNSNEQAITLQAGQVLNVAAAVASLAFVYRLAVSVGGQPQSLSEVTAGNNTNFGPYPQTERFKIVSSYGTITATIAPADLTALPLGQSASFVITPTNMSCSNGLQIVPLDTAITANVTTTTAPDGSIGFTSHATGRGKLFMSDGTKWQFAVVA